MNAIRPLSVLIGLWLGCATAQADGLKRIVPSGVNQQIDFFASLNPDCSSIGIPTVRLVEGPFKGVVTTDKGRDFMTFLRANPRHVCNSRRVAGVKLFYKSQAKYFGPEHIRILILSGAGTGRDASYDIQVR